MSFLELCHSFFILVVAVVSLHSPQAAALARASRDAARDDRPVARAVARHRAAQELILLLCLLWRGGGGGNFLGVCGGRGKKNRLAPRAAAPASGVLPPSLIAPSFSLRATSARVMGPPDAAPREAHASPRLPAKRREARQGAGREREEACGLPKGGSRLFFWFFPSSPSPVCAAMENRARLASSGGRGRRGGCKAGFDSLGRCPKGARRARHPPPRARRERAEEGRGRKKNSGVCCGSSARALWRMRAGRTRCPLPYYAATARDLAERPVRGAHRGSRPRARAAFFP